jgi:hypothetical protein
MNGYSHDPQYYVDFAFITGFDDDQIEEYLNSNITSFYAYMNKWVFIPMFYTYC